MITTISRSAFKHGHTASLHYVCNSAYCHVLIVVNDFSVLLEMVREHDENCIMRTNPTGEAYMPQSAETKLWDMLDQKFAELTHHITNDDEFEANKSRVKCRTVAECIFAVLPPNDVIKDVDGVVAEAVERSQAAARGEDRPYPHFTVKVHPIASRTPDISLSTCITREQYDAIKRGLEVGMSPETMANALGVRAVYVNRIAKGEEFEVTRFANA